MAPYQAPVFVLLTTLLLLQMARSEVLKGKATRKAPDERHQTATVDFNIRSRSNGKMTIKFDAFGKSWKANLRRNNMLFASGFSYEERTMEGKLVKKRTDIDLDSYWIGPVDGGLGEGGMAAFCITKGLLIGYVTTDECDLEIEPNIPIKNMEKRSAGDTFSREYHEGKNVTHAKPKNENWRGPGGGIHLGEIHRPSGRRLNLETGTIVESDFQKQFKVKYGDGINIGIWIAQIFNGVQLWYLHPNFGFQIWVTLSKIVLINGDFPVKYKGASLGVYSACVFQSEKIQVGNKWDNIVLLTTNVKIMAAGGRAIRASACGAPQEHCASVGPMKFYPADVSRGISHEMAHTMGMPDDYTLPTGRVCQTGLMRHHQNFQDWSVCSVQRFEEWLRVRGNRTSCLLRENTPGLPEDRRPPNMPLNVAWRSNAKQSSTAGNDPAYWGAWKAVDGSVTHIKPIEQFANISSCARTQRETDPWLRVRLPDEFLGTDLDSLRIVFPKSEAGTDMKNLEVRVGKSKDFKKQTKCFPQTKMLETKYRRTLNLKCEHERGWMVRYITIKKKGKAQLSICEVYAFKKLQVKNYKKPTLECLNEDPLCWDFMGKCTDKESDIRYKCPYTCGDCKGGRRIYKPKKPVYRHRGGPCDDRNRKFCKQVVADHQCQTKMAQRICKTSCKSCKKGKGKPTPAPGPPATHSPGCKDSKKRGKLCPDWKTAGYCSRKRVRKACQRTCGVC